MDKEYMYMYQYNGVQLMLKKKNETMLFVTAWMDLEITTVLSEVTQKDKYTRYHLYVET